jgi:hypothetical protein
VRPAFSLLDGRVLDEVSAAAAQSSRNPTAARSAFGFHTRVVTAQSAARNSALARRPRLAHGRSARAHKNRGARGLSTGVSRVTEGRRPTPQGTLPPPETAAAPHLGIESRNA